MNNGRIMRKNKYIKNSKYKDCKVQTQIILLKILMKLQFNKNLQNKILMVKYNKDKKLIKFK